MLLKLDFRDVFELESKTPVNEKDTECRFDYLEVRDGKYGFSTLIKTYCGSNFPPEIISKSRYLWLHFHSDDTIEYRGFKAIWTMVPRPTNRKYIYIGKTLCREMFYLSYSHKSHPCVMKLCTIYNEKKKI